METLYRIEEYSTTGWTLIETHQRKLTRDDCKRQLELYIESGHNPNHLRAVPDAD